MPATRRPDRPTAAELPTASAASAASAAAATSVFSPAQSASVLLTHDGRVFCVVAAGARAEAFLASGLSHAAASGNVKLCKLLLEVSKGV